MTLTLEQLEEIMPQSAAAGRARRFVKPLNEAMEQFNINKTVERMAAFLGQIAHESGQLHDLQENLNYSAQGLMATWPKRFPSRELAEQYARQPQKIANFVYANRMGNGGPESGDGWRYRGAGLLQLTGYEQHKECGDFFQIAPAKVGDWLRTPEGACKSAGWYWFKNGLNALADAQEFVKISKRINGGSIGLEERLRYTSRALAVLHRAGAN